MSRKFVSITRRESAAIVALNRPEALNALSVALEDELRGALTELAADETLRAIILTGAGRAFCAGVDLKELGAASDMEMRTWHGPGSLAEAMRASPVPIVAAVNGFAVTGGLELALNCDFIIASTEAKFADTHARVGITPSWGMSQILSRLIGVNRAKQMSLTGQYIDARRALSWGLINEAVAPDALIPRALEIAAEISETDAQVAAKLRRLIDEGSRLSLDQAMALEAAVFDEHMTSVAPAAIGARRQAVQDRGRDAAGAGA